MTVSKEEFESFIAEYESIRETFFEEMTNMRVELEKLKDRFEALEEDIRELTKAKKKKL